MRKIVIDTNIIISAAISQNGNPAKIINMIRENDNIQLYYSAGILNEYKKVLSYERLKIVKETQINILNEIESTGILIELLISDIPMPDESDRIFYDAAKTVNAYLITGNIKHYPDEPFILTPAQFVEMLEN